MVTVRVVVVDDGGDGDGDGIYGDSDGVDGEVIVIVYQPDPPPS